MRLIFNIPNNLHAALDLTAKKRHVSQAEIIRSCLYRELAQILEEVNTIEDVLS